MSKINILVTLDKNYLYPLKIMLVSLFINNSKDIFDIYVMNESLTNNDFKEISKLSKKFKSKVINLKVKSADFQNAPVLLHYTKAMYFRLLAHHYLPKSLDKIIYLDPDILVLNSVKDLYELKLGKYYYGAAYHKLFSSKTLNKIRLYPHKIVNYFNSGVLLINLKALRTNVSEDLVFNFVRDNREKLIMPDQDVLNSLFAKKIRLIDEMLYNYDARHYNVYKVLSNGKFGIKEVVNKTVFLHFCGKQKPWFDDYHGKFNQLYQHYVKQYNALI
jgi:lipopolysaccharide biosynthesis glycosyltransferase